MSLYINDDGKHIYKNDDIMAPNQSYFQTDYRREMVEQQQRMNETLLETLNVLQLQQQQLQVADQQKWQAVSEHMQSLEKQAEKQITESKGVAQQLQQNHNLLQTMAKKDEETKQQQMQELAAMQQQNQILQGGLHEQKEKTAEMDQKLAAINRTVEGAQVLQQQTLAELAVQFNQAETMDQKLKNQSGLLKQQMQQQEAAIANHEAVLNEDVLRRHAEVEERLDGQEAILEKILRQVGNLRSIVYERSSHLADKMEEGFRLSSAFAYNLITRKDQSVAMVTKKDAPNKQKG